MATLSLEGEVVLKRIIVLLSTLLMVYGSCLQQASAQVPAHSTRQLSEMERSLRTDYQRFRREISGGDLWSRFKGQMTFVYDMKVVAYRPYGNYDLVLATCKIYGKQHLIQAFQRRGDVHWGLTGGVITYPPCVPVVSVGGLGFLSNGKRVRLVSGIVLDKSITSIRIENAQHIPIHDAAIVGGQYYLDVVELPQRHARIYIDGIDRQGRPVRSTCDSTMDAQTRE